VSLQVSEWLVYRAGRIFGKAQLTLTYLLVIGTLKGYDQLMNLVLDEVKEALTGTYAPSRHCRCRRLT
jgi:hypothetical protein